MEEIKELLKKYKPKGLRLLRRKIASFRIRHTRGIDMDSFITLRCNMKCSYCPYVISGWKYNHNERPLRDWIFYINNNVPYRIKRMAIMGGEPSIIDWVGAYVNFLLNPVLNKPMCVTIYTNLKDIYNFMIILPSPYLYFNVTYHEKYADKKAFIKNLETMLQAGHNVKFSYLSEDQEKVDVVTGGALMREQDYEFQCCRFRLAPDLTMHARAWDIAKYMKI